MFHAVIQKIEHCVESIGRVGIYVGGMLNGYVGRLVRECVNSNYYPS
jgi:hypothetical protein